MAHTCMGHVTHMNESRCVRLSVSLCLSLSFSVSLCLSFSLFFFLSLSLFLSLLIGHATHMNKSKQSCVQSTTHLKSCTRGHLFLCVLKSYPRTTLLSCYAYTYIFTYGVATISRLLKMIGLFCTILSLLWVSFAKETYHFKEPTSGSHPISCQDTQELPIVSISLSLSHFFCLSR